jgi:hypothetical protein
MSLLVLPSKTLDLLACRQTLGEQAPRGQMSLLHLSKMCQCLLSLSKAVAHSLEGNYGLRCYCFWGDRNVNRNLRRNENRNTP